ncbi:uncharacterized protein LOC111240718 [Vigna radiata var. radiata]|uniref:Uncharacterized protein LOC111240718 n=1 Tax=Vigna radiata var. radiata TaxID=3916 RepID=A0A3Q0ENL6_VIGRR|nr:uncharacterized protein LOC111240718 [Vigna radiata var. radiata]
MGPATLLSLLPMNLEGEDLSDANVWLFPILKHYIVGAPLHYFTEEILVMIKRMREKVSKDTAKSFMNLEKHLRSKLKEEPDIRGIICTSLRLLIQQNNILDLEHKGYIGEDMAKEQVHYSQQVARDNLYVLKSFAKNWLKYLSEVFLKSTKDDGGCLQILLCNVH